jgi:hypothetical protein
MFKDFNRMRFNSNTRTLAYRQVRHYSSNSCSVISKDVNNFVNPLRDREKGDMLKFSSYLAGLIEGVGHIAVHDKNSKSKVYRPKIIIVFNIHDRPLAEKLSAFLKVGKVINRSSAGHVLLQILAKEEVLKIINLINGRMRTPKIEALHRAISWINEKDNSFIPYLGLDTSSLDSNS